jgi:uncharacterized protein YciI
MKNVILILTFVVAIIAAANNKPLPNTITTKAKDSTPTAQMKQYWLVLLKAGPNRNHTKVDSDQIQAAHMATISRFHEQGKIIMAGPMGNEQDLRGLFIMNGKDSSEIASLVATDSAVITGLLRFEVHPWWTVKGKYEFK